jgi:hypothetical protein
MLSAAVASFALLYAWAYYDDARMRANANECISTFSDDGLYRAESCVLSDDGRMIHFVGRVYSTQSGELLAEKTFVSPEREKPFFSQDLGSYENVAVLGQSDAATVQLPPSWLERMQAKVP